MEDITHIFDYITPAFFGVAILSILYFYRLLNCSDCLIADYGYEDYNGPTTWAALYPCASGDSQSPVHIRSNETITLLAETIQMLSTNCAYSKAPKEMVLHNDSHTVVVHVKWCRDDETPIISGSILTEPYKFLNMRFRWGPRRAEGSEHLVDNVRYCMELQTMYIKASSSHEKIENAALGGDLLVISYFYRSTSQDNPYLEPIIEALKFIRQPFTCHKIRGVPIQLLAPGFLRKYYTYEGSLTFPPCTQGVVWIVCKEPLLIADRQVDEFRKLCSCDNGSIFSNSRPVQNINDREVFYYD